MSHLSRTGGSDSSPRRGAPEFRVFGEVAARRHLAKHTKPLAKREALRSPGRYLNSS